MSVFSKRIAALPPQKQALLEAMRKDKSLQRAKNLTISKRGTNDACVLSFAQQRLWFFDQLEGESALYNIAAAVNLHGQLDVAAFEKSFNEIISRHEILRTRFIMQQGQPLQVVSPVCPLHIRIFDLRDLAATERQAELLQLAREEGRQPFNLADAPLLRLSLVLLTEQEYGLFLTMHHIISDGWSIGILLKELTILYTAFLSGKPSPLPALPLQYADYAHWQRHYLQGEVLEQQLSYWLQQLHRPLPTLQLPTDRPRTPQQTFRGAVYALPLPEHLVHALKTFARAQGVTLFMLLLSAFHVLLHRYTQQDDIIIGSPIANRKFVEIEGLIGCFINNLVLRSTSAGDPPFLEFLQQVRKVTLEAYDHQDLPFEKLVEALHPQRTMNHPPLLQVAFALEDTSDQPGESSGLIITPLNVDRGTAKLDILLSIALERNGAVARFEYNSDLFNASTIIRMAGHFQTLLHSLLAHPEHRLSMLSLLNMAEKQETLKEGLNNKANYANEFYAASNLTKNQFHIWMGQQLQPDLPIYNSMMAFSLSGQIFREDFQWAFEQVVAHTEALRTIIEVVDAIPQQKILTHMPVEIAYLDFSQRANPQEAYKEWLEWRRIQLFDLAKCPFVCVLIKIAEDSTIWFLGQHHIITDARSTGLIYRQVAAFYTASRQGRKNTAITPVPGFQAYLNYERRARESRTGIKAQAYWDQKRHEKQERIFFYGKAPLKKSARIRRVLREIEAEQVQALYERASQYSAAMMTRDLSLFSIFLTLLFTYLYRISGNRALAVGTPFQTRISPYKDTIGCFMEACPLHITISENETFSSLHKKVRHEIFEALQHYPYTTANFANQTYDVLLNYHTATFPDFAGLPMTCEWVHSGYGNDSLNLQIFDFNASDKLTLAFDFHCDIFDEEQSRQAIQHFMQVLAGLLADQDQLLDRIELISAEEKQRIYAEFNTTSHDVPTRESVVTLFEASVQRNPDAIALVCAGTGLTYRELNGRANQLARYLHTLGAVRQAPIGVCVDRSPEMLVALLAILKAGAPYVPLDPSHPQERLMYMIENCQIKMLLLQYAFQERFADCRAQLIFLDTEWDLVARQSQANLADKPAADSLMYLIYTSGSSGKPKGVGVYHRGFANLLHWFITEFSMTHLDQCLVISSLSFDLTQKDLFAPLLVGGTVHLYASQYYDPLAIRQSISAAHITLLNCTPSAFYPLVEDLDEVAYESLRSLRLLLLGGEPIHVSRIRRWIHSPSCKTEVVNTYGPTEGTDVCAFYRLESSQQSELEFPPIGRPIFNTRLLILDRFLFPVPIGVTGELVVLGDGVSMGYVHDAELTATKFLPDPFTNRIGSRLYRTGDLARYQQDGTIEFLGRRDHQIKLHGFRIELEEVASVLRQHPALREVVVLMREDTNQRAQLVACVVPQQDRTVSHTDLYHFLKSRLPVYMIPTAFLILTTLPLTPHGKIDHNALKTLPVTVEPAEKGFSRPRSPEEITLSTIWAQVLGKERVGIHDNFFELGGDSILSIQIVARANQAGLQFTPKQLFQYQTIAELALVASTNSQVSAEQGIVTGSAPLTPIQHLFFQEYPSELHRFSQRVFLQIPTAPNRTLLAQALQHILGHHDALRLRFFLTEKGWEQRNMEVEDTPPIHFIDASLLTEQERRAVLHKMSSESQASLDITAGPLMHVIAIDYGPRIPGRLLIVLHHLVVDGISWRILLEDLFTAYTQLCQHEPVKLPAKSTSFKEWAHRLVPYASSTSLLEELPFWLDRRASVAPLPVGRSEQSNSTAWTRTCSISLPADETRNLLSNIMDVYHTQINDILLTALVQTFADWTCTPTLLVDLEGHGREALFEDVDLSRTVGWFTTLFPVLLDLTGSASPGEAIKSVKEQLRRIPQRGIGYGILRFLSNNQEGIEALRLQPAAEVSFNYLGQFDYLLPSPSPFRLAPETGDQEFNVQGNQRHLLEINAGIVGGCLQMTWSYRSNCYDEQTIENLAQSFRQKLRTLIAHCLSPESGGYTPSDFPLARLGQQQLDHLVKDVQDVEDIYVLSPLQQGMLFHTLYAPESGAYFNQTTCVLTGKIDLSAFERACQHVLNRHSSLRSSFHWEGLSEPLQVVSPVARLPLASYDWRELAQSEQEMQFAAYLEADRRRGFDLKRPPLLRLAIFRVTEERYQLAWSYHHLLADGWSQAILFREILTSYEAYHRGLPVSLQPVRPYRDYIAWLQKQPLSLAEAFWRKLLDGFTETTPLRIVQSPRASAAQQKHIHHETGILLSKTETEMLQSLVRQEQLTLNTLVQGIWALLLSHYSGHDDVVYGTIVSGRPPVLPDVETMVGLFINTLPMRVHLPARAWLPGWLKNLQALQVEMRQHEHTPLVQLHGWSQVRRTLPLFESLVVFENYPVDPALDNWSGSLQIGHFLSHIENSFPLTIRGALQQERLSLQVLYDPSRLDAFAASQLLRQLESLLRTIMRESRVQLATLKEMLATLERQQQLNALELEKSNAARLKVTKRQAVSGSPVSRERNVQ